MPEELAQTQEVFLTGTAVEVTPVSEIGEYRFTPGEITFGLLKAYDDLVSRRGQFAPQAAVAAAE